jgi:3-methyladenine DNA glycosylase AlkD
VEARFYPGGMTEHARAIANEIEEELRAVGTPERAEGSKKYLKSDLEFTGATVPDMRTIVKGFKKKHSDLSHEKLIAIVEALWSKPVFERRMTAVFFLGTYPDLLSLSHMPLLERLIRESKTWALVDSLSTDIVGRLVERNPRAVRILDRWATDEDFWIRRAAMLSLAKLLRRGEGFDVFSRYAERMLDEKEFFIRKAIGWMLREYSKKDPDEVFEWLAPKTQIASGVTMREAVKYLSPQQREELMTAYKENRPAA